MCMHMCAHMTALTMAAGSRCDAPPQGMALPRHTPYHSSLPWQGVEGAQNLEVQMAEARVMAGAISEAEAEIAALMSSAAQTKKVRVAIVS